MVFHSAMNCPLLQRSPWYCTLFLTAFLSVHTVHLLLKHRQPRLVSKLRGLVKSFGVETSGSVAKCRLFSQASCVAAITKTERRPGHIDDSIRVACFGYWEMAIEQWHLGIPGTNNSFLGPTSQCSKQPFWRATFFGD